MICPSPLDVNAGLLAVTFHDQKASAERGLILRTTAASVASNASVRHERRRRTISDNLHVLYHRFPILRYALRLRRCLRAICFAKGKSHATSGTKAKAGSLVVNVLSIKRGTRRLKMLVFP